MPEYYVEWSLNITAGCPQEAAGIALQIQRDPNSTATVFSVFDSDGEHCLHDCANQQEE